jgi:hypothetical protein
MLASIPVFFISGSDFIGEVALLLVSERYYAHEAIISEGDYSDKMFILHKGWCVVSSGERSLRPHTLGAEGRIH